MTPYSLTEEAIEDLRLVRDYYDAIRIGLGDEFLDEFEVAMGKVCRNPLAFDPLGRSTYRRIIMERFSYSVIYSTSANEIEVAVVVHTHRRPTVWRKRLKK